MTIVLPDTSLCAIVRDELMNPAGGIRDFVESTVPYVERAVIVDTGSADGTREVLEELQSEYPNLEVHDIKFRGFAHARNVSLKHCKTKRALILDADERLTRKDFQDFYKLLERTNAPAYEFSSLMIELDGSEKYYGAYDVLNPRVFEVSRTTRFERELWELLTESTNPKRSVLSPVPANISIKHFVPTDQVYKQKKDQFYKPLEQRAFCGASLQSIRSLIQKNTPAPSELDFFKQRKRIPARNEYR